MLIEQDRSLYIYVVDRDFGFAPNPFHGYCTLATCKPGIRNSAIVGDWIMGVGGARLKATGKSVYLMKITEVINFNCYWKDKRFKVKKPVRNGSRVMMVGDNIYHQDDENGKWTQEDSHHSNPDGSVNGSNLQRDTKSKNVLISNYFYYFGSFAPEVDLASIGYKNGRNYSRKLLQDESVADMITSIDHTYENCRNTIISDPCNFNIAAKRVDQVTGIIK
jgi:Nucleotide modification associated domain 2